MLLFFILVTVSLAEDINILNDYVWPQLNGYSANSGHNGAFICQVVGSCSTTTPCFECENGKVVKIDVSASGLHGYVPAEIGMFTELRHFNASRNSLVGPLPMNFANLVELREFDVSFNRIYSNIPSFFTSLKHLSHFIINDNIFYSVPTNWASNEALLVFRIHHNKLCHSSWDFEFTAASELADCSLCSETAEQNCFGSDDQSSLPGICNTASTFDCSCNLCAPRDPCDEDPTFCAPSSSLVPSTTTESSTKSSSSQSTATLSGTTSKATEQHFSTTAAAESTAATLQSSGNVEESSSSYVLMAVLLSIAIVIVLLCTAVLALMLWKKQSSLPEHFASAQHNRGSSRRTRLASTASKKLSGEVTRGNSRRRTRRK